MTAEHEPNQHIWEYLNYYFDLDHPPGYAVMIRGPWGIGKTHLIRSILDRKFPDGEGVIYVSLYGVSDTSEIDNAVLAATYPVLGTKAAKVAGGLVTAAAKFFSVEVQLGLTDIIDQTTSAAYVFDDIERASMEVDEIFGYINKFVEHAGCRVVLVANEAELETLPGYSTKREKLVGQTLEARSEVNGALNDFLNDIKDEKVRELLSCVNGHIIALYEEGEVNNLRVLKQTLWDFERFCGAIEPKHMEHSAAMLQILRLLFAVSFEVKLGRMQPADIKGRRDRWLASAMAKDSDSPIKESFNRYKSTDLGDTTLSDELLASLLVHGVVDEEAIRRDLNASAWFLQPTEEPAWRTLWHSFERDDSDVERALATIQKEWSDFSFQQPGEMLHVFGLMLRLSDSGLIEDDRSAVVTKAKVYITSLREQELLPPLTPKSWQEDARYGSWGGLGICETETEEYGEIYSFLKDQRAKARLDRLPKLADQLMGYLEADPDLFFRCLVVSGDEESDLIDGPVLREIAPEHFLEAVFQQSGTIQFKVFQCLVSRYRHGGFANGLEEERIWVKALHEKMLSLAEEANPIRKDKLVTFAKWIASFAEDDVS